MTNPMPLDAVILGAGAAGLFCAATAAKSGKHVVVLEKQERPGKKILISGGGRCNFTNVHAGPQNFHSENPRFCKSALARFTPQDFIALIDKHGIKYHEKHQGQLFCDGSSKEILAMLLAECAATGAQVECNVDATSVERDADGIFHLRTADDREFSAPKLVIASGGLSYARLCATDLGLRLAEQFGHTLVALRPGLVPLEWSETDAKVFSDLSGVACPVKITCGKTSYSDDLLFTHTGLSGPAALQISTHWREGDAIHIDFLPDRDVLSNWMKFKNWGDRPLIKNILATFLPMRLSEVLCAQVTMNRPLNETPDRDLRAFCERLHRWEFRPSHLGSYDKAEVTIGGVDTHEISSQNMESRITPGLFFIGEVMDVTGDLGGFNFQWAWASAYAAGTA